MNKCEHCGHPTYKLNDWVNGVPNVWDYEAVLHRNDVVVNKLHGDGYQLCWKQGFMHIAADNEVHAHKAAALFVELWLRGVSASFADKLMDGFLAHLELQDN